MARLNTCTAMTVHLIVGCSSRLSQESGLPTYLRSKRKPHENLLLGLAVCLYLLAVACWAIDIAILRLDLIALLPNEASNHPNLNIYDNLSKLRGAEMYAQAIVQVVIVGHLLVLCI